MKSVADQMMERFEKPKKGGVNSPFNDAVDQVKEEITDMNWSFGRWCGHLKGIPPFEILSMLQMAKKSDCTGRHFNWLIKDYKQRQKKHE